MDGLGREKKDKKCSGLVQAQFFTGFYHSQLEVYSPETCGSLPNANQSPSLSELVTQVTSWQAVSRPDGF